MDGRLFSFLGASKLKRVHLTCQVTCASTPPSESAPEPIKNGVGSVGFVWTAWVRSDKCLGRVLSWCQYARGGRVVNSPIFWKAGWWAGGERVVNSPIFGDWAGWWAGGEFSNIWLEALRVGVEYSCGGSRLRLRPPVEEVKPCMLCHHEMVSQYTRGSVIAS